MVCSNHSKQYLIPLWRWVWPSLPLGLLWGFRVWWKSYNYQFSQPFPKHQLVQFLRSFPRYAWSGSWVLWWSHPHWKVCLVQFAHLDTVLGVPSRRLRWSACNEIAPTPHVIRRRRTGWISSLLSRRFPSYSSSLPTCASSLPSWCCLANFGASTQDERIKNVCSETPTRAAGRDLWCQSFLRWSPHLKLLRCLRRARIRLVTQLALGGLRLERRVIGAILQVLLLLRLADR